jgi:hypothetical protein
MELRDTPPETAPTPAQEGAPPPWWRRELRAFGEIFALYGLAVVQPLLDLFGRTPHQFVFRGAEGADVALFAFSAAFVPPVLLWVPGAVVGLISQRVRRWLHVVVLAGLAWCFAVQLARPLTTGAMLMALAGAMAVGGAVLYLRHGVVRVWLAFLAVAPVLFVAMFLFASPSSRLLGGDRVAALGAPIGSPAPVVLVVLDEFPLASIIDAEGRIDRDVAPTLAEFADDAHWFRNATTPTSFTWYAVPSMLTGMFPEDGTAPFAADHPQNLFTRLAGTYGLNVVESTSRLCPSNLCEVAATDQGGLIDDAVAVMRARLSYDGPQGTEIGGLVEPAADIPEGEELPHWLVPASDRWATFLDGVVDDSLTLHFLHVLMPHNPYRYVPSGRTYPVPSLEPGREPPKADTWNEQEWPATFGRQRHLLQVRYTDTLVGEVVTRLRQVGLYEDALVIITSDHGIAFQPGSPIRMLEGQPLVDDVVPEMLWVPLLVKLPGQQAGEVSDADVMITDIFPTIADVLDMELPAPVDGRSLFGPERSESSRPFWTGHRRDFGVGLSDEILVDGEPFFEALLEEHHVEHLLLPPGEPDRLWRVGPRPELIGAEVGELPPVANDLPEPTRHFDPTEPEFDLVVRTFLHEDIEPGTVVAVAVDGVIAATAPVWTEADRPAVAAILNEAYLEPGPNEITIHRLGR